MPAVQSYSVGESSEMLTLFWTVASEQVLGAYLGFGTEGMDIGHVNSSPMLTTRLDTWVPILTRFLVEEKARIKPPEILCRHIQEDGDDCQRTEIGIFCKFWRH